MFCEQVRAVHAVDIIKGKELLTNTELNPESQLKQSLMAHACRQRMSQFLADTQDLMGRGIKKAIMSVSSLLDLRRMFRAVGMLVHFLHTFITSLTQVLSLQNIGQASECGTLAYSEVGVFYPAQACSGPVQLSSRLGGHDLPVKSLGLALCILDSVHLCPNPFTIPASVLPKQWPNYIAAQNLLSHL